jgi:hypothetical protein
MRLKYVIPACALCGLAAFGYSTATTGSASRPSSAHVDSRHAPLETTSPVSDSIWKRAVSLGFPDTMNTRSQYGRMRLVIDDASSDSPGLVSGYPSPTLVDDQTSSNQRGSHPTRVRTYKGPMRRLGNGNWLMDDCELVDGKLFVETELWDKPGFSGYSVRSAVNESFFRTLRNLLPFMGSDAAGVLRAIDACHDDEESLRSVLFPVRAVFSMRSGGTVPGTVMLLIDARLRLESLRKRFSDGRLALAGVGVQHNLFKSDDDAPSEQRAVDAKIRSALASESISWPVPRQWAEVEKGIIYDWFHNQVAVHGIRGNSTIEALRVFADDADKHMKSDVDFLVRCLSEKDANGASSMPDTVADRLRMLDPRSTSAADANRAPFVASDLDALVAQLGNRNPSRWVDAQGIGRPIADVAVYAIAGILGFDPRLLLGMPAHGPWLDSDRQMFSEWMAAWRARTGKASLDEAVCLALRDLDMHLGIRLFMSMPQSMRVGMRDTVADAWLGRPFDASTMKLPSLTLLVSWMIESKAGAQLVKSWNLSDVSPYVDGLAHERMGDTTKLIGLFHRLMDDQEYYALNHGKVRDVYAAIMSSGHFTDAVEMVSAAMKKPLNEAVQELHMAAIFGSDSIDEAFQALAPLTTGGPREIREEIPVKQWRLWASVIGDKRALPDSMRAAISVFRGGRVLVSHSGAKVFLRNAFHGQHPSAPAGDVDASSTDGFTKLSIPVDLRISDLAAWSIAKSYPSACVMTGSASYIPAFFLLEKQSDRDFAIANIFFGFIRMSPKRH